MASIAFERSLVEEFPKQCRIYGMEGCSFVAGQAVWLAEQVGEGRINAAEARKRAEAAAVKIADCLGQQRVEAQDGGIFCARRRERQA